MNPTIYEHDITVRNMRHDLSIKPDDRKCSQYARNRGDKDFLAHQTRPRLESAAIKVGLSIKGMDDDEIRTTIAGLMQASARHTWVSAFQGY